MLEQKRFPVVCPALSGRIPCARAGLRLTIPNACQIVHAVIAHVNILFVKKLLVRRDKVFA